MAVTISLQLSDAAAAEVVNALCAQYNYQATDGDGQPNPETPAQFARRMLIQWVKGVVLTQRRATALAAIDTTDPAVT